MDFSNINYIDLFGTVAAEDDTCNSLKGYFYKSSVYKKMLRNDKLFIL